MEFLKTVVDRNSLIIITYVARENVGSTIASTARKGSDFRGLEYSQVIMVVIASTLNNILSHI